jgi:hypothetical protein
MDRPVKAIVTKKNTVHMYSELWHASACVLDAGLGEERGSSWQFLSSSLLTAFSFEAYLNHVGAVCYSCWDELERLPPISKLSLLCESLKVVIPPRGERPLSTIIELMEFRNTMAHGRTQTIEAAAHLRDINDKLDGYLGEMPLAHWQRLIGNADFARRVRTDVEALLTRLHNARPAPKEALFTFGMGEAGATIAK